MLSSKVACFSILFGGDVCHHLVKLPSTLFGVGACSQPFFCTSHLPECPSCAQKYSTHRHRDIGHHPRSKKGKKRLVHKRKMASFLSHVNPTPAFPSYTGPCSVGSYAVEIPIAELPSHLAPPDPNITTVSFRVFYPCEVPSKQPKPVYWIPETQKDYLRAYAAFCGASPRLSRVIQYVNGRCFRRRP